jgi:peptidoglycan/xylan/chitin deacetylase (PgdA/CDA1 family)
VKTQLKKLFVPALASRPVSALATSILGHGVPIFMLHRMNTPNQPSTGVEPEYLRQCLRYLVDKGYTFVSLEDVILSLKNKTKLPKKAVAFTMDDGFSDQGNVAAPIFLEFNCPLTFFVITGLVSNSLWPWDAQVSWIINNALSDQLTINFEGETLHLFLGDKTDRHAAREQVRNIIKEMSSENITEILSKLADAADLPLPATIPSNFEPLDWDTARKLESKGIRFAPHSATHRILSKLSRKLAEEEIVQSWGVLNEELSNPLKVFCYPTGRALDFGPREISILKNQGFLGAASTVPGYVETNSDPEEQIFRLPRFELPDNMMDFIQCCSWIERAKQSG